MYTRMYTNLAWFAVFVKCLLIVYSINVKGSIYKWICYISIICVYSIDFLAKKVYDKPLLL